jgi:hypothetical protein
MDFLQVKYLMSPSHWMEMSLQQVYQSFGSIVLGSELLDLCESPLMVNPWKELLLVAHERCFEIEP